MSLSSEQTGRECPIQKSQEVWRMDLKVLSGGSGRRIAGIASTPEIDRENESILKSALEDALEYFMQHPIVHLNHSERPIGTIRKALFQGDDLYVEADIYDDASTDDVWNLIQKGILSQWSIFGRPRAREGQCALPPHLRTGPCITKSLWLDSISVCPGGNAINPKTYARIIKAMTSGSSSMIHPTADGVTDEDEKRREIKKMNDGEIPPAPPGGDMEPEDPIQEIQDRLMSIEERLTALEGGPEDEDLSVAPPDEGIQKGTTSPTLEERLTTLETENAELKKAVVHKTPYIVPEDLTPEDQKSLGVRNILAFGKV